MNMTVTVCQYAKRNRPSQLAIFGVGRRFRHATMRLSGAAGGLTISI
jgi:hypothetical protein